MTKTLLIIAAALSGALHAQISNFQTPAWMNAPIANPMVTQQGHAEGQMGPIKGKPFSGTEVRHTIAALNDGSHADKSDSSKIYRDVEGRMRDESTTNAIIYDPVAGFIYTLSLKNKTYTRDTAHQGITTIAATTNGTSISTHGTSSSPSSKGPSNPGLATEDLGFSVASGISVKGSRSTLTIPAAVLGSDHDLKVVNESWYSEDLGILVKSSNSDPRFGTTTYELTNINQSTPDPALFEVPSGYTMKERPGR